MYMYINIYVYVYVYKHIFICIYICVYVYMHTNIYMYMYMYMYIYMSRESLNLFIHYQLSADCTIYFTAENSSLFAFSWKPRANDCSMVILGETRFNSAVKLVGKPRIVLFGLRFSVFEIYISPLVLLLTASGPYLLL